MYSGSHKIHIINRPSCLSGTGLFPYLDGNYGDCYRSPAGFPQLISLPPLSSSQPANPNASPIPLSKQHGVVVDLVACSGAKLGDMFPDVSKEYTIMHPLNNNKFPTGMVSLNVTELNILPSTTSHWSLSCLMLSNPHIDGDLYQSPFRNQLDSLGGIDETQQLITVTLGANDLSFSTLLAYCMFYPGCDKRRVFAPMSPMTLIEVVKESAKLLKYSLIEFYQHLKAQAPNATIVAVGYPLSIANHSCDSVKMPFGGSGRHRVQLSNREAGKLRNGAMLMNQSVKEASRVAGVHFVDVTEHFDGHGVCGVMGEWIEGVSLLNPSASFHPTREGQREYGRVISRYIHSLLQPAEGSEGENNGQGDDDSARNGSIGDVSSPWPHGFFPSGLPRNPPESVLTHSGDPPHASVGNIRSLLQSPQSVNSPLPSIGTFATFVVTDEEWQEWSKKRFAAEYVTPTCAPLIHLADLKIAWVDNTRSSVLPVHAVESAKQADVVSLVSLLGPRGGGEKVLVHSIVGDASDVETKGEDSTTIHSGEVRRIKAELFKPMSEVIIWLRSTPIFVRIDTGDNKASAGGDETSDVKQSKGNITERGGKGPSEGEEGDKDDKMTKEEKLEELEGGVKLYGVYEDDIWKATTDYQGKLNILIRIPDRQRPNVWVSMSIMGEGLNDAPRFIFKLLRSSKVPPGKEVGSSGKMGVCSSMEWGLDSGDDHFAEADSDEGLNETANGSGEGAKGLEGENGQGESGGCRASCVSRVCWGAIFLSVMELL
eukprot:GHVN01083827.1.p1 GENE.GHVN01083827.1~~GHVN01083827.1.p1  ORF type:complete len:768 (-),score=134.19 GHVN01083827.1:1057-3360(-)